MKYTLLSGPRAGPVVAVVLGMTTLAGCSSTPGICPALAEDTGGAASLTHPVIPGYNSADSVQARIELMDRAGEPPAELASAWTTWRDYLAIAHNGLVAGDDDWFLDVERPDDASSAISAFAAECRANR